MDATLWGGGAQPRGLAHHVSSGGWFMLTGQLLPLSRPAHCYVSMSTEVNASGLNSVSFVVVVALRIMYIM